MTEIETIVTISKQCLTRQSTIEKLITIYSLIKGAAQKDLIKAFITVQQEQLTKLKMLIEGEILDD